MTASYLGLSELSIMSRNPKSRKVRNWHKSARDLEDILSETTYRSQAKLELQHRNLFCGFEIEDSIARYGNGKQLTFCMIIVPFIWIWFTICQVWARWWSVTTTGWSKLWNISAGLIPPFGMFKGGFLQNLAGTGCSGILIDFRWNCKAMEHQEIRIWEQEQRWSNVEIWTSSGIALYTLKRPNRVIPRPLLYWETFQKLRTIGSNINCVKNVFVSLGLTLQSRALMQDKTL